MGAAKTSADEAAHAMLCPPMPDLLHNYTTPLAIPPTEQRTPPAQIKPEQPVHLEFHAPLPEHVPQPTQPKPVAAPAQPQVQHELNTLRHELSRLALDIATERAHYDEHGTEDSDLRISNAKVLHELLHEVRRLAAETNPRREQNLNP